MITRELFGKKPCGCEVYEYTLQNDSGANVKILTLGGIIRAINVPDKNGVLADVVCGYDDVKSYLTNGGYQGALIGRFGNRINNSSFIIDGREYKLFNNEKKNHLHGGKEGFDKKLWDASAYQIEDKMCLELTYLSDDMEEGYPGNLFVKVTYSFDNNNTLTINYKATTDKKTVLNLTNHAYFNLGGYDSGSVENHTLWIDSDKVSEVNSELIPTGKEILVENTPFDFREEKLIGKDINAENELLKIGQGYDHNFILNSNGMVKHIATLKEPVSGREMKVYTNQPCVLIYAANCINENDSPFKNGVAQKKRCAVCLETQHAPDSPNHKNFPSCELNVGELYDYTTVFKFNI
ncbi:MAG: galactose mutarotase [Clostridia bacterium]|nr:galactose mutarotase [Clostridia bacterium]